MSNHNSTGMHNILDIFKKLEPTTQEQTKAEAQRIYESVEAQGSILKGVTGVEKRLSEAYAATKEGTYGNDGIDYSGKFGDRKAEKPPVNTKFDTSGIASMIGKKTSKPVGKVSAVNKLALPGEDDDISDTDPTSLDAALKHIPGKIKESESGERPYVCVHAKKGKCEVHAKSSYEAAQKAAAKWKLKNTSGIDSHLADVKHTAVDESDEQLDEYFHFDSKSGKDTGKPDELSRRAKLGKNPLAKGSPTASEYKQKGKYGDMYNIAGPKGILPEGEPTMPSKKPEQAKKKPVSPFGKQKVAEGVNFTEMMKKQHMTLEEMLKTLSDDIAHFKRTGHVSEPLRDCMSVYEYGKTQLSDAVEPEQVPAFMRKANEPGRMAAQGANDMRNANAGADVWSSPRTAPMTEPDEELNELARLAGLSLEEGVDKKAFAALAESGMMKQLGGLAVGGGSILSTMWMNAMGMIDGVLAHAAAGEVGGAVASGSILGLIPVTLMLFAAMLMFKGSKQSSDEKAQAFQAQRGQQGVAEGYQLDEGAVETITALVKKIPGIGKYYQMAQQYKPQLIEILKTSKSGKEVKQKMEQLAASQSATVAEPKDKITYADKIAGATKNEGEEKADDDYDHDGKIETGKQEYFGSRRRAAGLDECVMGDMASEMEQTQGKINVSTNASSDGNKSVSINADGAAAEQLMAMLKLAGLGSGEAHAKLAIAVPAEGGDEVEVDEAQGEAEYANVPKEEYGSVEQITSQGADMNRQKKQFADKPKAGDNPMATPESVDPVAAFGRDLMAEYQALKLKK